MTFENKTEAPTLTKPEISLSNIDRLDLFEQKTKFDTTSLNDNFEIAGVGFADRVKTHRTPDGGVQTDYSLGGNVVYSDAQKGDGSRVRTSYDMGGHRTGKRIDFRDGSHSSTFNDGFEDYAVMQDRSGTHVMKKNEDGKYIEVKDSEERRQILDKEREQFQAPATAGKART